MSGTLPPLDPTKTAAGITLDPRTLERIIPQSRRSDGSVRKELKVRPGFTPQEDVQRFRGTKQTAMDSTQLPKGHILGWVPPSSASGPAKPLSKSAKKNAKRKEKRVDKAHLDADDVADNWEDDEEQVEGKDSPPTAKAATPTPPPAAKETAPSAPAGISHTADSPHWAAAPTPAPTSAPKSTATPASTTNSRPGQSARTEAPIQRQARPVRPNNSSVVSKLAAELKKLDTK